MNMMKNSDALNSKELIQDAKENGFFDSNLTIKCDFCNVIFPEDYGSCPQCSEEK